MHASGISYIDMAIIVILIYFIYRGFHRGFTDEFFRILGMLLSLLLAIKFMSNLANPILENVEISPIVATLLSFTIIFLGSLIIFNAIKARIRKVVNLSVTLGQIDKVIGGTLGLFKGTIIVSVVTMLISAFTFAPFVKSQIESSFLFDPMRNIAPGVYEIVKTLFPNSKSFLSEINESIESIPMLNRDLNTQAFIDFYTKKK